MSWAVFSGVATLLDLGQNPDGADHALELAESISCRAVYDELMSGETLQTALTSRVEYVEATANSESCCPRFSVTNNNGENGARYKNHLLFAADASFFVERNASGVKLRRLSTTRTRVRILCCGVKTMGKFFTLDCSSSLSCINEYLDTDSGG